MKSKCLLFLMAYIIANQVLGSVVASSVTGPDEVEPGEEYTFTYSMSGGDVFFSQITAVFYLTKDTIAPGGLASEEIGRFTTSLAFQDLFLGLTPRYKAQSFPWEADITIPLEFEDSSWASSQIRKDSIPPGDYNIVMNVLNTFAYHEVTVPEIEITGLDKLSAEIGENIRISGSGLRRASKVFINGEEVLSFRWSYSSSTNSITATVPSGASASGVIEVGDEFHMVVSSDVFNLELPELEIPVNSEWNSQVLLTASEASDTEASLQTGEELWLRFTLSNTGTADVEDFLQARIYLDNTTVGTRSAGLFLAQGADADFTQKLGELTAGTYELRIEFDPADFVKELDEMNNVYTQSFTVTSHPVDQWRNTYFTPSELADSSLEASLWGDIADPDKDGLENLLEYYFSASPISSSFPEGSIFPSLSTIQSESGITPTLILSQSSPVGGISLRIRQGQTLDEMSILSAENYTTSESIGTNNSVIRSYTFPEVSDDSSFFQIEVFRIF